MEERACADESSSAASSNLQPEEETGASTNCSGKTETSMGKDGSSKPTPEIANADAVVVGEDEEQGSSKKGENGACIVRISSSNETENSEDSNTERVCRICHLNQDHHHSTLIQLGCSCKDELGISHLHCAETWFKRKGNRRCEICGATAINVTGLGERGGHSTSTMAMNQRWRTGRSYTPSSDMAREGSCCWGRKGCNLFLTSLVLAFTFLWFLHLP